MGGEADAAGEALTGTLVAHTVDAHTGAPASSDVAVHATCRNCGTALQGSYCSRCGQSAHIHRSLLSLGHDILHGAFHFEGKIWRTLPELILRPGHLTRRYVDGERAKFVSPMALFLFTVFAMFAVFSLSTASFEDQFEGVQKVGADVRAGSQSALETTQEKIAALEKQLEAPDVPEAERARIVQEIADLKASGVVMDAIAKGEWQRFGNIREEIEQQSASVPPSTQGNREGTKNKVDLNLPNKALEARLEYAIKQATENPALLVYKLKTNGYKFSWALIPLSLPFLWLLFFWRRDIHAYDHAIFATYSITFMMMLIMAASIAASLGVPSWIWGTVLTFAPPIHMYKQLRYAYGLSRAGTLVRLVLLMISIAVVLAIFGSLLLVAGVFA